MCMDLGHLFTHSLPFILWARAHVSREAELSVMCLVAMHEEKIVCVCVCVCACVCEYDDVLNILTIDNEIRKLEQ